MRRNVANCRRDLVSSEIASKSHEKREFRQNSFALLFHNTVLPYQLEPEYSSTSKRSESEEEEEDDSIFPNANTSDCRLDTSWCLCEQCTIMPTEVASIFCKEPAFLSKMVEGIV